VRAVTARLPSLSSASDRWVRSEPLAGDASTRRYRRLTDRRGRTAILAEYPPDLRPILARDLEVMSWLAGVGLRLPAVFDRDLASGRALLEDLGPADADSALRAAPEAERPRLAAALLSPLEVLAAQPVASLPAWNRPLDATRLRWELAGFELWFVRYRQGVAPGPALDRYLDDLAEQIANHPLRICHRDFHLNNLYFVGAGGGADRRPGRAGRARRLRRGVAVEARDAELPAEGELSGCARRGRSGRARRSAGRAASGGSAPSVRPRCSALSPGSRRPAAPATRAGWAASPPGWRPTPTRSRCRVRWSTVC
jgi:aminoglycoside phosphotransferase